MKSLEIIQMLKEVLGTESRMRLLILALLTVSNACLQTLSVASIMPVAAVMADRGLVNTNSLLNKAFVFFKFDSPDNFIVFLAASTFATIAMAQTVKMVTNHQQVKFCTLQEHLLSKSLLSLFLYKPYSWLLQQDTAELNKNILSDVHQVIEGVALPALLALSQFVTVLMLFGLIYIASPGAAIAALITFSLVYIVMYKAVKPYIERIGRSHYQANEDRYLVTSDALNATKEIKVGGFEDVFISRFTKHSHTYASNYADSRAVIQIPRTIVELIAIGGMLVLMLLSSSAHTSMTTAIPLTALYSFAAYRLMPALQQIYTSYSEIRGNLPALEVVHARLKTNAPIEPKLAGSRPVNFERDILLSNVSFRYPKSATPAVINFSLKIKAGSSIAIVGQSGSGKSTLATLLTGLLSPSSGFLAVDNIPINASNVAAWRHLIGYVPQQIYLSNDTVAANIAFGSEDNQIDQPAVEQAARLAQLHDFVCESLPHGYDTLVGERGIRLSGGQRQRIAVARALYKKPKVLILDEATSALDNITERLVMNAINNLPDSITSVVIAHRLSTVKQCSEIVLLEKGQIVGIGTYDELLKSNTRFEVMVNGEA